MKSSLQTSAGLLTERLARHHADLTGSERALAEALQRDYPHALLESATALAARNGTSASTVVRLFAKLGYASYAEAQREARAEVTALLQTAGQRAPVTIGAERTLQQCVDDALLHDQHNLSATREGLNLAAFEAMATCLAQDKGRVHVLAQINSAPVGSWLALHLNMCRPGVQELGAGAMDTTDQLLWVQPDDVLLVFSIRRYASGLPKWRSTFATRGPRCWPLPTARPHPWRRWRTTICKFIPRTPHRSIHTPPRSSCATRSFLPWPSYGTGQCRRCWPGATACGTSLNHSACWILPPAAVLVRAANQQTRNSACPPRPHRKTA